jgi:hypothetical protein
MRTMKKLAKHIVKHIVGSATEFYEVMLFWYMMSLPSEVLPCYH